uniref:Uncharacterized protein n=1 Tax=Oryza sativa subsp. japonica TaxID=39947 RepID=Q6H4E5_ORYSJ|nr:hypothetical protein [Oryza sativa Japonica Group]
MAAAATTTKTHRRATSAFAADEAALGQTRGRATAAAADALQSSLPTEPLLADALLPPPPTREHATAAAVDRADDSSGYGACEGHDGGDRNELEKKDADQAEACGKEERMRPWWGDEFDKGAHDSVTGNSGMVHG